MPASSYASLGGSCLHKLLKLINKLGKVMGLGLSLAIHHKWHFAF